MSFKTFLRHVREGFKNVFRNGWMSVASITSIVVSLFVLGVFILLVLNVNSVADKADNAGADQCAFSAEYGSEDA